MLVCNRMSKTPYTIPPTMPVDEALRRMREVHVRRFPVVDKDNRLVGIVSEKDLLYASPSPVTSLSIYEMHYLLSRLTVAEVMTKDVISVEEDTAVEEAARIMADKKIGALPVVRDGALVGIVTETDLFKLFIELLGARERGVRFTLLVPNKKGVLAGITTGIAQHGGNIIALGTFLGEDPSTTLVAIKVVDVPTPKLVEILQPQVVKIIDVREV
jgi:acetoin utilization protein AcuB